MMLGMRLISLRIIFFWANIICLEIKWSLTPNWNGMANISQRFLSIYFAAIRIKIQREKMRFAQRIGKTASTKLVQRESVYDDLRNSLCSAVTLVYCDRVSFKPHCYDQLKQSNSSDLMTCLWLHHFKEPVDQIPHKFSTAVSNIRNRFFSSNWHELLDLVEAIADYGSKNVKDKFISICNSYFERENSAYRFVNWQLSEITSEVEIEAVEQAINAAGVYGGVQEHLQSPLNLLNDRANPDYRNSIKESISAVESLAKILSGDQKATLGQALSVIEKNGNLHQALKSAFSSLYGYTSDADGIRHALLDESTLKKADARFMLVSCSSFVNYLIELSSE